MKKLSIFAAAALMLAAVSCNKEAAPIAEPEQVTPAVQKITFTAYADNGADTRTILDGNDIKWAAGETIYVFDGTAPRAFTSTNTEEAAIVTFEGAAAVARTYTAVSPAASMTGNTINATIPVFQTATPNSFDPKANVSVAVANGGPDVNPNNLTLQFKNAGAVVKFKLTDADIVKVRLDAIGGEKLAGKASITLDSDNLPTVAMASDAESCVILKPVEGNFAANTTYAIAIAPGTYAQGFKLTLFKADGKFKSFSNKNIQTLARNSMMDFRTIPTVQNWNEIKKDVLTNETTGVSGTAYDNWTATGSSKAEYAGRSAGANSSIQLRTKDSSEGVVMTKSAGNVASVSVEWEEHTSAGRIIDIYGKNTAYSSPSDLFDEDNQGELLGSIGVDDSNSSVVISGNYSYIGIRSRESALYLSSITIVFAGSSTAPVDPVVAPDSFTVTGPVTNVIPAAGGTSSFSINANIPWTISLDDESAGTTYELSTDGDVTTVEVAMPLLSSGSRTATFTVTPSKGEAVNVTFRQFVASSVILTFPDDNSDNNSVNNYTSTWTAQKGDYSFTIKNFNNNNWNNWTFIRCGSKSSASTGSIQTQKIDFAVSEIVVTVDSYSNNANATTKLEVASDANFSTLVATVNVTMKSGELTYSVPSDKQAANLYYRVSYACQKSSNGAIQISKVVVKP